MEELTIKSTPTKTPPLHTIQLLRRTPLNRAFAAVYMCAILALFYHHTLNILHSTTVISTFLHSSLLIADFILAFMWSTTQSFRMRPVHRRVFVENLQSAVQREDYPAIDVFICTTDPFKEPPLGVVNTALSVMAYDYPTDKISVYVSDDGGSKLTLFAFFEAAKFAKHWLPFCRNKCIIDRSPEVYFNGSHYCRSSKGEEDIKMMYERMKARIENVVERREVNEEYIDGGEERDAFQKWSNDDGFTSKDHPTVIQVLLECDKDCDISGHLMPNLVYVSRQKSNSSPHHFKAGALNVLLRVSATMTNAPIVLTQDCDMYSNDPLTPQHALCYFSDPDISRTLGFVQFPQRFHGISMNDIYACEHKHLYQIKPVGMDGLAGPSYVGSGCFFSRKVFFGSPISFISPETKELRPDHIIDKSVQSKSIERLAHHVSSCTYENDTKWGSKMGFRYGSLAEDYNTGYHMHCQGWKSIFCHPERAAFLGDIPISLFDVLTQNKRWIIGHLQICLSKYSPITFGVRSMGILMGIASSHDPFWPFLSIPMVVYAFLPQLALLNRVSIFPKATEPCFQLYTFLFIGAYTQDLVDFILAGGTFQQWWNNQRMWMIRGLTSYLFGVIEYMLKLFGLSVQSFSVTSKITDEEQSKRYKQELFEFGVESPMFVTLTSAALVNIVSFSYSLVDFVVWRNLEGGLVLQTILAGLVVLNCWPIYDAVLFRSDKGKMPIKVSLVSVFFVWVACRTFSFLVLKG